MAAFKVNISKSGDAIKFVFTDSNHYLYGDGEIEVPVNSLSLVVDESNMVTFKKAASNDIFLTFDPANSNLSDKAGVINFYKTNMVGSTGGGGGGGITSGEVQTMIDNSLDDYYDKDEIDSGFSTVNQALSGKADTTAVTAVANDVQTVSGQVATKVATSDFNTYTAATATAIGNKQDALEYYEENTEDGWAEMRVATDDGDGNTSDQHISIGGGATEMGNYQEYNDGQGNSGFTSTNIQFSNPEINIYAESEENGETEATYFNITPTGVTINDEAVATEPYVDAATSGKADTSAVTAVNNTLTAHTSDTTIHVTSADKTAWNGKQDALSAGTGIEISGNVISATGGGGSVTVDPTLDTGSTNPVANSAITQALENKLDASAYTPTDLSQYWTSAQTQTAIDNAKAYYISFATIATTGIRDEDWDGIVAAIDDHRPIYAGYPRNDGGILYYGVECMNKNVSNTQIVLTSSDDNSHYFYTFTKNGSNDYTFTSETRPYVTDAEKTAWNAKAEPYSAGTGIEISGNVISATGGGGATYSAGTNISIDTANTINCTIPAYFNADERKGDIAIGTNINNVNSDYYKVVIGRQIDTYGNSNSSYSIGIGPATNNTWQYSQLKGNNSVGIGKYFQITAHQSVAIGSEAKSSVVGGVAIGYGVDATGTTKMNLNNQIKVDTNNQVYIKDKTNTTDVCIQDAIAALGGLKLEKISQAEYDQLATKDPDTLYIITNVVS